MENPPLPVMTEKVAEWSLDTPVAFFVFNRPELTAKVFQKIREVEPSTLFVIADGPRSNVPSDEKKVRQVRSIVTDVDWECDVRTFFSDTNLGVKRRIQTGVNSVFNDVERCIFLEDDCFPNTDFFRFCQTLLDWYDGDERVMDISGSNHLKTWHSDRQDYHFTRFGGIWGWATWRDAWKHYDPEMTRWDEPVFRDRVKDFYGEGKMWKYVELVLDRTHKNDIETWDYQWMFTKAINWGLTASPSKNLISNIGFNSGATHTQDESSPMSQVPRHNLTFPLDRTEYVCTDGEYDKQYYALTNSIWERNVFLRQLRHFYVKNYS